MKQKTALQQLLEKFDRCNGQLIREDIEQAILDEQAQIEYAYDAGFKAYCDYNPDEIDMPVPIAFDYYKNKYHNDETN